MIVDIETVKTAAREKEDIENRTKLLVDLGLQTVSRLQSHTDQLNTKILSSFQNFLVIISLELTLFVFWLSMQKIVLSFSLPCLLLLFNAIGGIVAFSLFVKPKKYRDVDLFSEERFNDLCGSDTIGILNDHLDGLVTTARHNLAVHKILKEQYIASLILLVSPLVTFPISVYLIWVR